jgi:hypothetical protein
MNEEKKLIAEKRPAIKIWKEEYESMLSHKPNKQVSSDREDCFVMLPPPQVHPSIMEEARKILKESGGLIYVLLNFRITSSLYTLPVEFNIPVQPLDDEQILNTHPVNHKSLKKSALFDLGAQVTTICRQLDDVFLNYRTDQVYQMWIRFGGTQDIIQVPFLVRDVGHMPNGSAIAVIGLLGLIDRLTYKFYGHRTFTNNAGSIELQSYSDIALDLDIPFTSLCEDLAVYDECEL